MYSAHRYRAMHGCATSGKGSDRMHLVERDNPRQSATLTRRERTLPCGKGFFIIGQTGMEGKMQKNTLLIIITVGVIGLIGFWRLERGGCVEPVVVSSPTIVGDSQPVTVVEQTGSDSTIDRMYGSIDGNTDSDYREIKRESVISPDGNYVADIVNSWGSFEGDQDGLLVLRDNQGNTLFEKIMQSDTEMGRTINRCEVMKNGMLVLVQTSTNLT